MKKIFASIIILLVVVAAAAALYFHYTKKAVKPGSQNSQTAMTAAQPQPTFVEKGQITPDFPKELVMGAAATPATSYSIQYPNASQETTVYETSDPMKTVYNGYLAYFKTQDASMNQSETATRDEIYAIIPKSDAHPAANVSVLITPDGSKTKVTVSYLKK